MASEATTLSIVLHLLLDARHQAISGYFRQVLPRLAAQASYAFRGMNRSDAELMQ
jgi:hypothetical protein